MPCALVTGITGQDGSYLAEVLLGKGYEVYGLVRRLSTPNYGRIAHLLGDITLLQGDLLDETSLLLAINKAQPDEVYNLGAQSHVGLSFEQPTATGEYTGLAAVRLLEALRMSGGRAKFYQASTSELFGEVQESPQNEQTLFHPRSPYGVAKLYAHWATINYRESYGMYACAGLLFNHESPRRGLDFVTRKITSGIARIRAGLQDTITLGNLDASRDWGFAGDYVEAMWLMLQQETPEEYVIATGETHTIREFLDVAFKYAGYPNWRPFVTLDPDLYRPADVNFLVGDASKARRVLGWRPRTNFRELVAMMVESDIKEIEREAKPLAHHPDCCAHLARSLDVQEIQRIVR